jgi:DNA helicase II / ATP-dependent DNA helicase PcrA
MIAGAGSGKTTSLVKALDHLRRTRGVRLLLHGQRIACITYTEIAANEILDDVAHGALFHVSTIHSFLWTLIRPFQNDIHAWVRARLLRKLIENGQDLAKAKSEARRIALQRKAERYTLQLSKLKDVEVFSYGLGSDYSNGILGHADVLSMVPELMKEKVLLRKLVASRFPFIFVDESQDTAPKIVSSLMAVHDEEGTGLCLGFFGDPMQQIYLTGVGDIEHPSTWPRIEKPENFRCAPEVLAVINRIRSTGDGLQQTGGRSALSGDGNGQVQGTARLFVAPASERRRSHLDMVRTMLATAQNDLLWHSASGKDVRVLVVVHRMASSHLGFAALYSAMNDNGAGSLREAFIEGTAWPLTPFLRYLLPLAVAQASGDQVEVLNLLRAHCPVLRRSGVNLASALKQLQQAVQRAAEVLASGTIREALTHALESQLVELDARFAAMLSDSSPPTDEDMAEDEDGAFSGTTRTLAALLDCQASELRGYRKYVEGQSPLATQQGIKGAEFPRVLVIVDDEEGSQHKQFSYNQYFGLETAPGAARGSKSVKKETSADRTRRLFYVCCSRALEQLAVVVFAADVRATLEAVRKMRIFREDCLYRVDDSGVAAAFLEAHGKIPDEERSGQLKLRGIE